MTTNSANRLIDQLIRCVLPGDGEGQTDGDLLTRFVERHDKSALNALVRRHGTMVWGVCVRALPNHHDAEDAFQATFLVLVRKAATVLPREMVGNWLYGVAHQVTLQARRVLARRRAREMQVIDMPDTPIGRPDVSPDLRSVLDEELVRLPAIYRAVIVLCDLEGRTRKEVAHYLSVPEGTVGGRLARARAMLGKRLARRGVLVSGPVLGTVLTLQATASPVPAAVVSSAIKVVASCAAEQAANGVISPAVAELVSGVTRAMFMTKLKAVTGIVLLSALALGGVGTGIKLFGGPSALARQKATSAAEAPMNPQKGGEQEKQTGTAWGKEINGLQAGLAFRPTDKRVYHHGEAVQLVLRVRNVGKEARKFQHLWGFFHENPPAVTDAAGKPVPLPKGSADGRHLPRNTTVAPGKEVELYVWEIGLQPVGGRGDWPLAIHGVGKFTLQCEQVVGPTSANPEHPAPALDKLATGKLELEVTDRADKRQPAPLVGVKNAPPGGELREFAGTITAPVTYKDVMLVLVTKTGAAAVVFTKETEEGVEYKFRYESADGKTQKMGTGKVSEKDAPAEDKSNIFIEAGPIPLRWSYADKGKGWVYYDPSVLRVHLARAADYEDREELTPFDGPSTVKKLDLKRFMHK